jgi:hypothetical protein
VFYFAALLCAIQQMQGTDSTFSLCCFFYILVAAFAFNVAGGFTRTTGSFIFFNSVLSVILGVCIKAYLGEPADSNLQSPDLTIIVYLAGMSMMLVAVFLSRKLTPRHALLGKMVTDANMQTATVGSMVAGFLMIIALALLPLGNGTALSALNQLNRFLHMAIILGVINSIRRSGGTRSVNFPVLLSAGVMFCVGTLGYSKEGMFTPFMCWLLAIASQRYKISRPQLVGAVVFLVLMFRYMVPYSQYGRNFREENYQPSLSTSISLLTDLGNVREQYLESSSETYVDKVLGYYDTPQGLFDRLQMLSIDDALINHTKLFGTFGLYPIYAGFQNLVPHFIWHDKPLLLAGNIYAHEVGVLAEGDDSTGVSFSSVAVAFHLAGWGGIFLLAPALWLLMFTVFDSLCGDTRKSPWGLLVMVLYSHIGPEADSGAIIYATFFGAFAIVFAAIVGSYVMPVIGTFFIGPEGIVLRTAPRIRSVQSQRFVHESAEG